MCVCIFLSVSLPKKRSHNPKGGILSHITRTHAPHTKTHVNILTYSHTHSHAHTHAHTHNRTHVFTHTHTHTHSHTHTHTHTHARTHPTGIKADLGLSKAPPIGLGDSRSPVCVCRRVSLCSRLLPALQHFHQIHCKPHPLTTPIC